MTKAKTNALEALRALIAERQQYEQWITTLESKREGTPAHVFERVLGDYNSRLQRVVGDIKGHAEELQLSISALSSRLVEVAREDDNRRDALQEAELRATVGEYEPQQWEQLRNEAERALERIAADRAGLDAQLAELRSIQKLSEVGSVGDVGDVATAESVAQAGAVSTQPAAATSTAPASPGSPDGSRKPAVSTEPQPSSYSQPPQSPRAEPAPVSQAPASASQPEARDQGHLPLEQAAAASAAVLSSAAAPSSASAQASAPSSQSPATPPRPRTGKTPPFGGAAVKAKTPEPRTDQAKTLKCPECGTANYPTEWYCERCGGELATM